MYLQLNNQSKNVVGLEGLLSVCKGDTNSYKVLYLRYANQSSAIEYYYNQGQNLRDEDLAKIEQYLLVTKNQTKGERMLNDVKCFYGKNKNVIIFIGLILLVDYFLLKSLLRNKFMCITQKGLSKIENNFDTKVKISDEDVEKLGNGEEVVIKDAGGHNVTLTPESDS